VLREAADRAYDVPSNRTDTTHLASLQAPYATTSSWQRTWQSIEQRAWLAVTPAFGSVTHLVMVTTCTAYDPRRGSAEPDSWTATRGIAEGPKSQNIHRVRRLSVEPTMQP
jgi:hypothetical protein